MKDNKRNKPLILGLVTIILSLVLMNLVHFVDVVPDSIIRIIGVVTMLAAAVSVFFTVRALVQADPKANNREKE